MNWPTNPSSRAELTTGQENQNYYWSGQYHPLRLWRVLYRKEPSYIEADKNGYMAREWN